jgi:endonuclease YncB( thermonuclease family)
MIKKFLLILTLLTLPVVGLGQALEGARARALDGDSFEVRVNGIKQGEFRLKNIDAPELTQAYGPEAKAALAAIIETQAIRIVPQGVDQFGRTLAEVYVGQELVNKELVKAGNAWAFRPLLQDQSYLPLQSAAQAARLGLWAGQSPLPPWEYRDIARGLSPAQAKANREPTRVSRPPAAQYSGQCLRKRYCSQMRSCAEAQFYFRRCGVSSLDDDGDGKACEDICRLER